MYHSYSELYIYCIMMKCWYVHIFEELPDYRILIENFPKIDAKFQPSFIIFNRAVNQFIKIQKNFFAP